MINGKNETNGTLPLGICNVSTVSTYVWHTFHTSSMDRWENLQTYWKTSCAMEKTWKTMEITMISYRFSHQIHFSRLISGAGGDAALAFCCGRCGATGLGTAAADWRPGGSAGGRGFARKMKLRKRYGTYMENIWKNTPRDTTSDDIIKLWNCKTNIQQQMDCDVYECIWWIWHEIYRMDKSQRVIWLVHFWGCGDQDSKCFGWPWGSWFQCEVDSITGVAPGESSKSAFLPLFFLFHLFQLYIVRLIADNGRRERLIFLFAWCLGLWLWYGFGALVNFGSLGLDVIFPLLAGLCAARFLPALHGFMQGRAGRRNLATAQPWILQWMPPPRPVKAYDEATQHFCGAEFPTLRFQASFCCEFTEINEIPQFHSDKLRLCCCGMSKYCKLGTCGSHHSEVFHELPETI